MRFMRNRIKRCSGFTLIEAMLSAVILSIAAAGILLPFTSGAMARVEGGRRVLAAKLCSDLTEQIINTPFEDIVGTYDGNIEAQGQVENASGVVFSDTIYARYSRAVSCEYVYVSQESGTGQSKFVLVTVRVYYDGNEMAVVRRLVGK